MWKYVFVIAFAVGCNGLLQAIFDFKVTNLFVPVGERKGTLAEYQVPEDQGNQLRVLLRAQCKKIGGENAFADVERAGHIFIDCVKGLVDMEVIKREIEEAKPNGALDEVFKKYCAKAPTLKTCIHSLTAAITPCLEPSMKEHIGAADNATDQLIDFVCYKDGDRIALFIAEGGPECFKERVNAIRECGNQVKATSPDTIEGAKALTINEQCAKYDQLSACVVSALEECSTPTPGNMAEALFRFVRNGSPCKGVAKKQ